MTATKEKGPGGGVVGVLKEYKEVLILLTAIGSLAAFAPRKKDVSLETVSAQLDSVIRRLDRMQLEIDAVARVDCTSNARLLAIAGVKCTGE